MTVLVGVTSYTPAVSDKRSYVLPCQYVDCLRRAGVDVVLLPLGSAPSLLERLDGLVLAGGGDIDPELYGGRVHATTYMVDRTRDDFEIELLQEVIVREMPVLAICRGMQVLNVARGGSLVAHVPERYGETVTHRLPPREPVAHPVEVALASRLAGLVGDGVLEAVSWHHQAVDRLGNGLRVVASAADGVIEAVEATDAEWIFGVQWHPELNADSNRRQAALFVSLAVAAAAYSRRKR